MDNPTPSLTDTELRAIAEAELIRALAEGLWAMSRKALNLRADFMPKSRTDFIAEAADRLAAHEAERAADKARIAELEALLARAGTAMSTALERTGA